jgi:hypothetical protein
MAALARGAAAERQADQRRVVDMKPGTAAAKQTNGCQSPRLLLKIAENLHRSDLTGRERAEQIAE